MNKTRFRVARGFVLVIALCVFMVVAVLATRAIRHRRVRAVVLPVVFQLGGKVGSLPDPLGGAEYYVTFNGCTLTRDDIDRLVVLNELATNGGYVGLSVEGATISDADREYLRHILSQVRMASPSDK